MKKINLEMYKTLLFNIRKRVEETKKFSGFDIKKSHQVSLENIWSRGKRDRAITLLICYHYSRKESVIVETFSDTYSIIEKAHFSDIAELVGLSKSDIRFDKLKINSTEFEKIYSQLEDEINQIMTKHSRNKKISKWLTKYGIDRNSDGGRFRRLCKIDQKEFIIACILYINSRERNLMAEMSEGKWIKIKIDSSLYTILEKEKGIV